MHVCKGESGLNPHKYLLISPIDGLLGADPVDILSLSTHVKIQNEIE